MGASIYDRGCPGNGTYGLSKSGPSAENASLGVGWSWRHFQVETLRLKE